MRVLVTGGELGAGEVQAYQDWAIKKYGQVPVEMRIHVDGEYVDIECHMRKAPFERIRRITGYLVGGLERWNNGKRAEERDRVKHGIAVPELAGDAAAGLSDEADGW